MNGVPRRDLGGGAADVELKPPPKIRVEKFICILRAPISKIKQTK